MAKKSTAEQLAEQKDELTIDVGDEDVKGQEIILEDESSKETQTEMNLETSKEVKKKNLNNLSIQTAFKNVSTN